MILAYPSAAKQKNTCGSTVFSTGHPRQYSLAPAMLVCADRTRRGRFIAVWPQMKFKHTTSIIYPSTKLHQSYSHTSPITTSYLPVCDMATLVFDGVYQ